MSEGQALTLVLGGARSGKSACALELAARLRAPVTFIATAEVRDEEMASRISRHRAERPRGWRTVEEPLDLEGALRAVPGGAVVDCLSLWVANLMERELGDDEILELAASAARVAMAGEVVAVSNEVGWGIVPDNRLARRYRDVLGRVNQVWADAAERTVLVVAGRRLELS